MDDAIRSSSLLRACRAARVHAVPAARISRACGVGHFVISHQHSTPLKTVSSIKGGTASLMKASTVLRNRM